MNKYHVHVYRVFSMVEIEVEAGSGEDARRKAISRSKIMQSGISDCENIAIDFLINPNGSPG